MFTSMFPCLVFSQLIWAGCDLPGTVLGVSLPVVSRSRSLVIYFHPQLGQSIGYHLFLTVNIQ